MKKLKIALAAIAFIAVAGGTYASQAKQAVAPCTEAQLEVCIGDDAYCCDGPNGLIKRFVLPEQ